jgi:hypothetical protein
VKFQVRGGGWSVGQWLVPAGVCVDTADPSWAWLRGAGQIAPPPEFTPLDAATRLAMVAAFPPDVAARIPAATPVPEPNDFRNGGRFGS